VPNNSKLQYAEYINDLIDKHSVSIWNSAPLLLNILTNKYKSKAGSVGASLRLVMLSGDWIPMYLPDDIQTIAKGKPDVISLGGATEASIWSIYHPYCKSDLQLPSIPYGVPLNNQYFYILDENLQPCPFYVVGDLYIGGLGLANGYWRDEEKTSAAFISHPFSDKSIYKTGDLGKYLSSGEIQFHGRSDSQVKVSGYRIEMGEVEYALTKINGIKQAVVVAPYSANGDRFLAAYYQLEAGNKLTSDHIESELRQSLPSYMVPTIIKQLDSLPLTKNGKLDRSALSKVKLTYSESEGEPPTTELQKLSLL
jgi:pyochelin synthetase